MLNKKGVDQAYFYPNFDKGCGDHLTASGQLWIVAVPRRGLFEELTVDRKAWLSQGCCVIFGGRLGVKCHWPKGIRAPRESWKVMASQELVSVSVTERMSVSSALQTA